MKRLLLCFICLLLGCVLYAQDIITQKDGTDIQAKVTEVGISQISYKKYSNLDGPTYIINKDDILMITYENGEREIYTSNNETTKKSSLPQGLMTYNSWSGKVSIGGVTVENETLKLYLSPEDYRIYKNGKTTSTIGGVVGVIGAIPFGWCLGEWAAGVEPNTDILIASGIVTAGGLIVSAIGENNMKKVIHKYNSSLVFMPTINFGVSTNDLSMGLALVIHF